jgi:Zn-dependent protease
VIDLGMLLVPVYGEKMPISAEGWKETVDYLAENAALHDSVIHGLRQAPGIQVREDQALHLAAFLERQSKDEELPESDRAGLAHLGAFCRASGGFLIDRNLVAPEPEPVPEPTPAPAGPVEPPGWHAKARRILGPFAVVLIVAAQWAVKLKFLLIAITKLKFLSILVSAGWSFLLYAWLLGPQGAIALLLLLFLHEMGHVISYRIFGLGTSRVGFVPFFGAYALAKRMPPNPWVHAWTAIAGPVFGGLTSGVIWAIGAGFGYHGLEIAGWYGFALNLFNLVPWMPLDGGWIVSTQRVQVWFALALAWVGGSVLVGRSIFLMIFAGLAALQANRARKELDGGDVLALRRLRGTTDRQKAIILASYLGTGALLALAVFATVPVR